MARDIIFDDGRHPRAKIGYVMLATEQTVEDDVYRLCPEGVGVHFTRAAIPDSITPDTLAAQAELLAGAAAELLPAGDLDVCCYACTSGSLVIGEESVFAEFRKGAPNARPTTIITGVIRALRALGARRLAVATPYVAGINDMEAAYLEAAGFEIAVIEGLGIERDSDMACVTPEYLRDFALSLDRPDVDGLFISCSALRSLDVSDEIERSAGKPAVCSNQAMIWDCLRLAGIEDPFEGYGELLRKY